ncbi:uncharacterized protein [Dysidea avara]|uniref:uncharacterized protein isoform X2 n=1 Tax=Dysidea avara TaxID=196820 RepID=UPI003318D0E8
MDLIVITIDPRQQKRRCGKCSRCLAEECGTCKPCKDKPKFGGKGVQKHCCIHRQCVEISSKGATAKDRKQPLTTDHPTTSTTNHNTIDNHNENLLKHKAAGQHYVSMQMGDTEDFDQKSKDLTQGNTHHNSAEQCDAGRKRKRTCGSSNAAKKQHVDKITSTDLSGTITAISVDNAFYMEKNEYQCLNNSLISSKEANSPVKRCLIPHHNDLKEITWEDFLDKVDSVFPGILLCSHVSKARANHQEEIQGLRVGNIIVIETNRSNQVAFMRRLADEHSTPRIEIVSTYQTPDAGELNYHAGTASRSPSCN